MERGGNDIVIISKIKEILKKTKYLLYDIGSELPKIEKEIDDENENLMGLSIL